MPELQKYSNQPNFVGYPLYYSVIQTYNTLGRLCNACATECMESPDDIVEVHCSVNWENENLYCEECSSKIESAYADEDDSE